MSTHARTTPDAPDTHRPTTRTDPSDLLTDDAHSGHAWVARCQRQFDHTRTERLRNLADEDSAAMPDAEPREI